MAESAGCWLPSFSAQITVVHRRVGERGISTPFLAYRPYERAKRARKRSLAEGDVVPGAAVPQ
jgi:hypothetical protein